MVTNGSIDCRDIERAVQKIFGDKWDEVTKSPGGGRCDFIDMEYESEYYGGGADGDEDYDEDPFEDLIYSGETVNDEPKMNFLEEVPSVMEEAEAVEKFSTYLEETFFEARERIKGKGKGNGKKAKGYSKSCTFGKSLRAPEDAAPSRWCPNSHSGTRSWPTPSRTTTWD